MLVLRRLEMCHGALVTSIRGHDVTQNSKQSPGYYAELFRAGDLFLPVSRSLQDRVLAMGCPTEKVVVHHSGIDIDQFQWRARTRALTKRP
ncbi:MAG: colanic acid biosynthesis glycosyltransferase WcaL [Candidatus Competibacteraceae bacterium]|nr:colanic acid biosynthesis glycosyltransferase WcaL [Candidatus Competibacteraceae bacterium]